MRRDYDVAVIGAGPAGCAAAVLYARLGLEVVLIERRPKLDAHKTVCTHLIQSSALGALHRLGILDQLYAAGAATVNPNVYTPWGCSSR